MKKPLGRWYMVFLTAASVGVVNGVPAFAQKATIVKFPNLEKMMSKNNDTTYVFNFFATWCAPCVAEFPSFQRLSEQYTDRKLRVIFVSLDFKKDFHARLLPFLKKKHVTNAVVLLDETNYNSWIDKVDSTWEGDIPATLIVNNSRHLREIYPRELTYSALEAAVKPFLP